MLTTETTTWRTEVTTRLGEPQKRPPEEVPCHLLATGVTPRFVTSKESGSSRHVHCPSIDSCRHRSCATVHFGYAIPVVVSGRGGEIVFDNKAELDPRAAIYLLEHHPQLSRYYPYPTTTTLLEW